MTSPLVGLEAFTGNQTLVSTPRNNSTLGQDVGITDWARTGSSLFGGGHNNFNNNFLYTSQLEQKGGGSAVKTEVKTEDYIIDAVHQEHSSGKKRPIDNSQDTMAKKRKKKVNTVPSLTVLNPLYSGLQSLTKNTSQGSLLNGSQQKVTEDDTTQVMIH
ncbi:hypothetical protein C8R41DRAFT_924028 [Lentinula lateritia]|uniref:Uncharacterized protein n=1 Tax=Lentinula lateritia TaxID=40482 RepID=A0ABQ8V4G9_9AGAR|nr:hypothetical protein C8R41DRAFT_924028 [Lentinula lateritia]